MSQKFTDQLPTRMSLLQRASLEEQAEAWDELLKYYDPFVSKILRRWGISGADMDDVKQQVFMRLWKGLQNYKVLDNGSRFRNWLSTLIRRAAINWFNSNKKKRDEIEIDHKVFEELESAESELEKKLMKSGKST